jgi:hypothetical protein
MPNPIFRYPVDLTGTNLNNLITDELHNLPNLINRAVIPSYAPYYTETVIVRDAMTNAVLTKGVQYQCLQLVEEATIKTGKELCEVILITDQTVSNQVSITYQTIGGLYQRTSDAILAMYNAVMNDNRPVDWSNVLNKPSMYPPSLHNHLYRDIIGFEPMITELERIKNAIVLSDVPAFEALIDWFSGRVPKETIMIKPDQFHIDKDTDVLVELEAVNLIAPYTYYWSIEHIGTNNSCFGQVNGSINLKTGFNSFILPVRMTLTESGDKEFRIRIHKYGINGPVVSISGVFEIFYDYTNMLFDQSCLFSPTNIIEPETLFISDLTCN